MTEKSQHRLARLLRVAVSWLVAFHGSLMPRAIGTLYAQTIDVDSISVGVTPISYAPPASIADLMASPNPMVEGQISLSWPAPQGNVGGLPINNQAVAAYILHVATYSVASLSGDTTSWWNATTGNAIILQPPSYIPKTPGQFESYAIAGLIPGQLYYFAAKSISAGGITSPIDTESASPALQAKAVATRFGTGGTPMRPNGLSSSAGGGIFTLKWHPVTLDTHGQPITIDHYLVYRYDTIDSSPTISAIVPFNTPVFNDPVGSQLCFYRIFAIALGGIVSDASDYMDSSDQLNRYILAPEESATRITIPGSLAKELNYEFNGTSDDDEIIAIHQAQNENTVTLKSYLFQVQDARTSLTVPGFAFSEAVAQVQVSYALSGASTVGSGQTANALANGGQQAQAVAQLISLYWFNGGSFIRVGGTVLLQNQALMVAAKNLGLYEIRALSAPTTFALTRGSPYPRVITPNDPSQNNRVFWFFDDPTGDPVSGTIYDIRGAKVRSLAVNGQSPTSNSIVSDGRDFNNAVVPSGVYIYKISTGKESQTGTVVVAR